MTNQERPLGGGTTQHSRAPSEGDQITSATHMLDATGLPNRVPGASVQLSGVRHGFFHNREFVRAIEEIDLTIPPGQLLSVIGPSGCGKTTVLSMVAGLVRPRSGKVLLDGVEVTGPRMEIAYMPARDALLPWRTVQQNVELGLQVRGVGRRERHNRAEEWLSRVGLTEFTRSRITQLSQGMRQRVAIARTLAQEPRCILMDEPFAALDAQTRTMQQEEFLRLWEESGATVIFVTHDLNEAILLGDRVVLMSRRPGKIIRDVAIDLRRPRSTELEFQSAAYQRYRTALADALKVEVEAVVDASLGQSSDGSEREVGK